MMESNTAEDSELHKRALADAARNYFLEEGKTRINDLLFQTLPPETSISDMDDMAMEFYRIIEKRWSLSQNPSGREGQ